MNAGEARKLMQSLLGPDTVVLRVNGKCVVKVGGARYSEGPSWIETTRAAFLKKNNASSLEDLAKRVRPVPFKSRAWLRVLLVLRVVAVFFSRRK